MDGNQFNPYNNNQQGQGPEGAAQGSNVSTAHMYQQFYDPRTGAIFYTAIPNNQVPANAPNNFQSNNQEVSNRVGAHTFNTSNAAGHGMNAPHTATGPSTMPNNFHHPVNYNTNGPQHTPGPSIMPSSSSSNMNMLIPHTNPTTSGIPSGVFSNHMRPPFLNPHSTAPGASSGEFEGYMNSPSSNVNLNPGTATTNMPGGGFGVTGSTPSLNSNPTSMPNDGLRFTFNTPVNNSGTTTVPNRRTRFGVGTPTTNSGRSILPATSFDANTNSTSSKPIPSIILSDDSGFKVNISATDSESVPLAGLSRGPNLSNMPSNPKPITIDGASLLTVKNICASLRFYRAIGFEVALTTQGQITLTFKKKFKCFMEPSSRPTQSRSRHKIVVSEFGQVDKLVTDAEAAGGYEFLECANYDPETGILTRGVRDPDGFHEWVFQNKVKGKRAIAGTESRLVRSAGGHLVTDVEDMIREIHSHQDDIGMIKGALQQPRQMLSIVKSATKKVNEAALERLVKLKGWQFPVRKTTMPGAPAQKSWELQREAREEVVKRLMEQTRSEGSARSLITSNTLAHETQTLSGTLNRNASQATTRLLLGESYSEGSTQRATSSNGRVEEFDEDAAWREAIENFEELDDDDIYDLYAGPSYQAKGKGPARE